MNTNTITNKKTTLTALLPDGTTATRKTDRFYTHAIAHFISAESTTRFWTDRLEHDTAYLLEAETHNPDEIVAHGRTWGQRADFYRKEIAKDKAGIANATDRWVVRQWCGRPDLAAKAIAKADAGAVLVEVVDPRQS